MRRFFTNLNAPSAIVDDLLQREWRDAGVLTARTVINGTVGIVGLAGMGSGPYVIMPLLGPTTIWVSSSTSHFVPRCTCSARRRWPTWRRSSPAGTGCGTT